MKRLLLLLLILLLPCCAQADFEHRFAQGDEEITVTADSYRSHTVAIEITRMRVNGSDVYVADVYMRDPSSLRRGFAGGGWGEAADSVARTAEKNEAILAITGDSSQYFISGLIVGNGVVYRNTLNKKRDLCLILKNGEMRTLQSGQISRETIGAMLDSVEHTLLFGPALLGEKGEALEAFPESNVRRANPRSAIGYYEPGHYCLVQVDGRGTYSVMSEKIARNRGMTLAELAAFMEGLGCTAAYNLDGGQSAAMYFNGEIISTPAGGGRGVGDVVMIVEGDTGWLVF